MLSIDLFYCNFVAIMIYFATMDAKHLSLTKQLQTAGFSITKQRLTVFNALIDQEPLLMSDIVNKVSENVDRASTYRIIDLFEKLGIVQKLYIGWKYKIELTDSYHDHHHHMACLSCGKLIPVDGDTHIEKDIDSLAKKHGFRVTMHQLEIQGYCNSCNDNTGL